MSGAVDTMAEAMDRLRADEIAYRQDLARLRREIARRKADVEAGRTPAPVFTPRPAPLVDRWPRWGPAPGCWAATGVRWVLTVAWSYADRAEGHRRPLVALWALTAALAALMVLVVVAVSVAAWAPLWASQALMARRRRRKQAKAVAQAWANYNAWSTGQPVERAPTFSTRRATLFGGWVVGIVACLVYALLFAAIIDHGANRVADMRERDRQTAEAVDQ